MNRDAEYIVSNYEQESTRFHIGIYKREDCSWMINFSELNFALLGGHHIGNT